MVNLNFQYGWNRTIMKYAALKFLLKCIANDWTTVDTKTGRETMVNYARLTRITTIISTMMCHLVVASFVVLRLFLMKYDDNKLFVRGYYPYDTTISPNYELTMMGQVIAATYSTIIYPSVDTFIVMLVLHACGQISNLKDELKEIHSYKKTDLQMKLKKIVRKHNYIARFAETIENNFNIMLLLQILGCTVQICFQAFQAIMSGENTESNNGQPIIFQLIFLIYYVICAMVQLFLYCYAGEKLVFESTDVAEAAYQCEWYNLPPEIARLLTIIICRARASPLNLTAGKFFVFTILLYSQVVKTAVSYISVLHAVRS
ncbi:hypothetical protein E2986_11809 [Frieseomelitta varia]|uniref:Odorant receptor n=1 Tax=Frieseomelitta varia TaxID=561572 RepID=A0A833RH06_9HYME|nr:hypothetical protein E2986_11809 [Frieseomelitta varia]